MQPPVRSLLYGQVRRAHHHRVYSRMVEPRGPLMQPQRSRNQPPAWQASWWVGLTNGCAAQSVSPGGPACAQDVADACRTGAATDIIFGLALGYKSAIIPCLIIAVTIYVSFSLASMYGIACAALGMLTTMATGALPAKIGFLGAPMSVWRWLRRPCSGRPPRSLGVPLCTRLELMECQCAVSVPLLSTWERSALR